MRNLQEEIEVSIKDIMLGTHVLIYGKLVEKKVMGEQSIACSFEYYIDRCRHMESIVFPVTKKFLTTINYEHT